MYYSIKANSVEERRAIIAYLFELGMRLQGKDRLSPVQTDKDHPFVKGEKNNYVYFEDDSINRCYFENEEDLDVDIDEEKVINIGEVIGIIADIKESEVVLNSDYNAYIKDGFVEVGCQEISFEAVEKVYHAIQSKKERMKK